MATADMLMRGLAPRLAAANLAPPSAVLLRGVRQRAADEAWEQHRREAAAAATAITRREEGARERLAAVAEAALHDLRARAALLARGAGGALALAVRLDQEFMDPDAREHMDDPAFDEGKRRGAVASLDRMNEGAGIYELFADVLDPWLPQGGALLDLAAGHGGFAVWLARRARAQGRPLRITATDLHDSYLALGRERARAEGLEVELRPQDALDLSNLTPGAFDVVLCTQAVHHFPAGLISVMVEEATRIAGRAVVLVDGCRSALFAGVLVTLGLVGFRDPTFTHDSFASFRRFFVPEELGLLARLGAGARPVEAKFRAPNHCVVTIPTR
ncbi:MAG: hypothetical protein AMXMBFR64_23340 [Myxococcales bacterium]